METQTTSPLSSQAKCKTASTREGGKFFSFEFSPDERQEVRKLLFAVLCDDHDASRETKGPDDPEHAASPITRGSSEEFDISELYDTSEASTTDDDLCDGDFSDSEFSDDAE
jgi:hypothetical protein